MEYNDDSLREKGEFYKKKGNEEYYKKNFSDAIYFYTEGIKVKCNDKELQAKLYNNRAIAHFYLGNYEQSLSDAAAATDLQPTFLKAIERGANACVKMNRLEEAITWCDKGLTIDNNNKKLLGFKMECLKEQNKQRQTERSPTKTGKGTVSTFNQATEEELMHRNLGNSCFSVGDSDLTMAMGYYNQRVKISREIEDKIGEGIAYDILGKAFRSLGDFKKAIDCYERCLTIAKEVGDKSEEGCAYDNLGNAFCSLGDFKKARHCYQRRLTIAQEVGDTSGEGNAYGNLGNTFYRLGDFQNAIDNHNLSLKVARDVGDKSGEGTAYNNLGDAFYSIHDFQKAIDNYTSRLKIVKEVGDKFGEIIACGNLGNGFFCLGNFKKAIDNYDQCLKIAVEVGDKSLEESSYINLGNAYSQLGDFEKAMKNYSLCLACLQSAQTVSDKSRKGRVYGGLGGVSQHLGDFKKAIEYHNLHLTIAKEVGDKVGEGNANGNLGNAFGCLGDFQKALEYQQRHLEIAKEVGDKSGEGRANLSLGNAFYNVRNFQNAIEYFNRSREIAIELGNRFEEGNANSCLGSAFFRLGDFNKAKDYYVLHLEIAKEKGDRYGEGKAYLNLGLVFHGLGEIEKAIHYQDLNLSIAKEVKDNLGEAEGYYALGQVFESLNLLPEAFKYYKLSVRSFNNVRSLLEFKDEWKINFRNETNVFREAYTSLWRVLLKQGKIAEALLAAEEGRAQALTDLIKSLYAVQASHSKLGERDENEFESLSYISSNIVFQALFKGLVNFWVLGTTGGSIQYRLKELDDPIASNDVTDFFQSLIKNAYEEIGVRSGVRCEDRSLDALRDDTPTTDEADSGEESLQPSLQERLLNTLYDIIIEPIADLVQGSELIVVPDGPLWLVPYAALVDHNSKYLCESFKVRLVPSLTILQLIAECPEERQSKSDALLVGDPWYEEVVEKKGKKRKPLLKQLPFARKEVEMIGEILQVTPLIGKEATKNEVLKRLNSAALVHIAAHGSMETGEIALTPDPNRTSQIPKREDYTLTMADVLSIRLRARLVVLSCCHSGKGKIKAEGVVGIARAFLGAGARSVLMSLWAINDEATMEFMAIFYRQLVKGKSANESLNQAMKSLKKSDKYNHVKHWAPFVLVGDDVTLEFDERK